MLLPEITYIQNTHTRTLQMLAIDINLSVHCSICTLTLQYTAAHVR